MFRVSVPQNQRAEQSERNLSAVTGQHVNQTHEDMGAGCDQRHVEDGVVHHLNNACACVALAGRMKATYYPQTRLRIIQLILVYCFWVQTRESSVCCILM